MSSTELVDATGAESSARSRKRKGPSQTQRLDAAVKRRAENEAARKAKAFEVEKARQARERRARTLVGFAASLPDSVLADPRFQDKALVRYLRKHVPKEAKFEEVMKHMPNVSTFARVILAERKRRGIVVATKGTGPQAES